VAAIAWRKTTFRKYFDKEENLEKYHQLIARLLAVPTEEITSPIQDGILVWLKNPVSQAEGI
jgi:hypothetical protein